VECFTEKSLAYKISTTYKLDNRTKEALRGRFIENYISIAKYSASR
jgi:hypothetical protein